MTVDVPMVMAAGFLVAVVVPASMVGDSLRKVRGVRNRLPE